MARTLVKRSVVLAGAGLVGMLLSSCVVLNPTSPGETPAETSSVPAGTPTTGAATPVPSATPGRTQSVAPTAHSTPSTDPTPADGPCSVTPAMVQALRDAGLHGIANMRLVAECASGWAQLSAPDELGDTATMVRPRAEGYEFYTSFPSPICQSQYLADGGPDAFTRSFREC